MSKILNYSGQSLQEPKEIKRNREINGKVKEIEENLNPYIPEPDLVKAVNLAILLKRPLLLMGQPGCGKSKLAQAVAYELYHKEENGKIVQDYQDLYFEWNIKSSSKAKDGLYEYDAIERLGDSQIKKEDRKKGRENLDKNHYIHDRPLGQAMKNSQSEDKRAIILIDEIDKADIDFPNDLLNEIDKGEYTITEIDKKITSSHKPIIFITSNAEKPLPDAFLRRCLFHYIKPLKKETLELIIDRRFYNGTANKSEKDLAEKVVKHFIKIREELKKVIGEKNVSTSELLDWYEAIKYYNENKSKDKLSEELLGELKKVGKGVDEIPFQQVLFKNWNSLIHFKKKAQKTSSVQS